MKKLLIVFLLFVSFISNAQLIIAPSGNAAPAGNYPAIFDIHLKGGYRAVKDTFERNAIPTAFKKNMMLVGDTTSRKVWLFDSLRNSWSELGGGGSSSFNPSSNQTITGAWNFKDSLNTRKDGLGYTAFDNAGLLRAYISAESTGDSYLALAATDGSEPFNVNSQGELNAVNLYSNNGYIRAVDGDGNVNAQINGGGGAALFANGSLQIDNTGHLDIGETIDLYPDGRISTSGVASVGGVESNGAIHISSYDQLYAANWSLNGDGTASFNNGKFYVGSDGWVGNDYNDQWYVNTDGYAHFKGGADFAENTFKVIPNGSIQGADYNGANTPIWQIYHTGSMTMGNAIPSQTIYDGAGNLSSSTWESNKSLFKVNDNGTFSLGLKIEDDNPDGSEDVSGYVTHNYTNTPLIYSDISGYVNFSSGAVNISDNGRIYSNTLLVGDGVNRGINTYNDGETVIGDWGRNGNANIITVDDNNNKVYIGNSYNTTYFGSDEATAKAFINSIGELTSPSISLYDESSNCYSNIVIDNASVSFQNLTVGTTSSTSSFDFSNNDANRIYTLPNKSGTISLLDGYGNLEANSIYIGASDFSDYGVIKLSNSATASYTDITISDSRFIINDHDGSIGRSISFDYSAVDEETPAVYNFPSNSGRVLVSDNLPISGMGNGGKSYVKSYNGQKFDSLTTSQINLIITPQEGMQVYNSTLHTLCFYNGSSWQKVSSTSMN
jgi:hypothetical protein